jgi:hypothetical protein
MSLQDLLEPTTAVEIPDDEHSRPAQVLNPIPGVSFDTTAAVPRTLLRSTGTNRFHVILAYSSAALRSFLTAAHQAFNDLPGIIRQRDDLAAEVMRLRGLAPDPDIDIVTPPEIDASGAIVPEPAVTPPTIVIPDDHPQLVALRDERDDALARLATHVADLATAEASVQALTTRIEHLTANPPPPPTTVPPTDLRPEDSASNIRSEMLSNPTITTRSLQMLSLAMYASDNALLVGSTNTALGNQPTVQVALTHCADLAKDIIKPGASIARLSRSAITHYRTNGFDFALTTARALAPRAPHLALFLWTMVTAHTTEEVRAISARNHHECQFGRLCLISAMSAAPTAQASQIIWPFAAGFYILAITDGIEPRRYPLTVLELLSMIDSLPLTHTVNDIVRRQNTITE